MPEVNIILHVAVEIIFAFTSSSLDVTFGIEAVFAGSNTADTIIWREVSTYAIQSMDSDCTPKMPSTTNALSMSHKIISFLRLKRSVMYPARGEKSARLSIFTTIINPKRNSESEYLAIKAYKASKPNQSPKLEIACAAHNFR